MGLPALKDTAGVEGRAYKLPVADAFATCLIGRKISIWTSSTGGVSSVIRRKWHYVTSKSPTTTSRTRYPTLGPGRNKKKKGKNKSKNQQRTGARQVGDGREESVFTRRTHWPNTCTPSRKTALRCTSESKFRSSTLYGRPYQCSNQLPCEPAAYNYSYTFFFFLVRESAQVRAFDTVIFRDSNFGCPKKPYARPQSGAVVVGTRRRENCRKTGGRPSWKVIRFWCCCCAWVCYAIFRSPPATTICRPRTSAWGWRERAAATLTARATAVSKVTRRKRRPRPPISPLWRTTTPPSRTATEPIHPLEVGKYGGFSKYRIPPCEGLFS